MLKVLFGLDASANVHHCEGLGARRAPALRRLRSRLVICALIWARHLEDRIHVEAVVGLAHLEAITLRCMVVERGKALAALMTRTRFAAQVELFAAADHVAVLAELFQ